MDADIISGGSPEQANLPTDRFSWLGNNPRPDNVAAPPPDSHDLPPVRDGGHVHSNDGLGIIRWLLGSDEERAQSSSGCVMFDNLILLDIPRGDE